MTMNVVDFDQKEERSAPEETAREPQPPPAGNSGEDEEQQSALEEFPIECLPPILANMAKAISELGRWPSRLTAPLVLAAASASLGRGIRVKSYDGHETRPNMYLLIGKESGSGGTSAFRLAFAPVFGFQAMKRREFANGLKPILEGERATHEAEIEFLKRQARGKKSADERREISKQITEVRKALRKLDEEMCEPCFLTGDATPEGMTRLLAEHGETLCHADSDAADAISLDLRALFGWQRYRDRIALAESLRGRAGAGCPQEGWPGAARRSLLISGLSRYALQAKRALRHSATLRGGLAAQVLCREPSLPSEQNSRGLWR